MKHFNMLISGDYFRRWDMIKINHNGNKGIVTDKIVRGHDVTLTVYPYKPHKNRLVRMIKFWMLKLIVHYS